MPTIYLTLSTELFGRLTYTVCPNGYAHQSPVGPFHPKPRSRIAVLIRSVLFCSENFSFHRFDAKQKNVPKRSEVLWHEKRTFNRPIFPKTLAKHLGMCYNPKWVPVIRLYRSALSLLCKAVVLPYDSLPFCLCLDYTAKYIICQYAT